MDARQLAAFLQEIYSGKASPRRLQYDEVRADIVGRVSMVRPGNSPQRLGDSPGRRTAFVAGTDTVCHVLASRSPYSILCALGLTKEFIRKKMAEDGDEAYLILLHAKVDADGATPFGGTQLGPSPPSALAADVDIRERTPLPVCVPATWDGVVDLCKQCYPDALDDVARHVDEFRTRPVAHYEQTEGVNFLALKREPGTCMTYKRFLGLPKPRSAFQTRLFLYCEIRLLDLFAGDGYTETEQTATDTNDAEEVRLREYVCENVEIEPLVAAGLAVVIQFPVVVPPQ